MFFFTHNVWTNKSRNGGECKLKMVKFCKMFLEWGLKVFHVDFWDIAIPGGPAGEGAYTVADDDIAAGEGVEVLDGLTVGDDEIEALESGFGLFFITTDDKEGVFVFKLLVEFMHFFGISGGFEAGRWGFDSEIRLADVDADDKAVFRDIFPEFIYGCDVVVMGFKEFTDFVGVLADAIEPDEAPGFYIVVAIGEWVVEDG